ncbi:glycosyltransferase family A protein [soil metagenome]
MISFRIPKWVEKHNFEYSGADDLSDEFYFEIRKKIKKLSSNTPEVSIIVPVWNEEKSIARMISSIAELKTKYKTEILFINNNSTDRTQDVLDRCGVTSIFQPIQGISITRQTALMAAKGKYILSADSDSIYPQGWVDAYADVLQDGSIACAYGSYSFLPPEGTSRFAMSVYEMFAESLFALRRKRRGYLNVMGFNSAYRKDYALKIGGYNLKRTIWEDGWMALQLMKLGKLKFTSDKNARVWTESRRLMDDGGVAGAFSKRLQKEYSRIYEYVFPKEQRL